jgi:hypothetical protein
MEDLSVKERIERQLTPLTGRSLWNTPWICMLPILLRHSEAWDLEKIELFFERLDAELVADILVEIDEDIRTDL